MEDEGRIYALLTGAVRTVAPVRPPRALPAGPDEPFRLLEVAQQVAEVGQGGAEIRAELTENLDELMAGLLARLGCRPDHRQLTQRFDRHAHRCQPHAHF
jgi:hypothetical protein